MPPGQKVPVVVVRNGKEESLNAGSPSSQSRSSRRRPKRHGPAVFGLHVQDVTQEIAEQLGLDDTNGVVVSAVAPGSPAEEAGIRRGDVILEVDRYAVKNTKQLREKLDEADKGTLLLVKRGDATLFIPLKRAAG